MREAFKKCKNSRAFTKPIRFLEYIYIEIKYLSHLRWNATDALATRCNLAVDRDF